MTLYSAVPAHIDLAALEHGILGLWESEGTFETSLARNAGAERWTFFEGPPTANGMPGTHHVEARVFKDVFPRFRTMQGYLVERKAGWDCHGLPVELAVEKELGFSGKGDIENYGVAAFNSKCRESVLRNVDAFQDLTRRMGYWVDLDRAYQTMAPEYVDSVWWALKQIFDKGLLVEDYRVAPYCPRCGTGLSDHELAQGYETVVDPSVYVRFPLTSGPLAGQAELLVWTTTPWTLVSNTAVAVNPEVTYVVASRGTESLVVAEPLADAVLGEDWTVTARYPGAALERWTYQRPFDLVEFSEAAHYVVLADYVTTEDGTGLVHQAPAFGEDDMVTCRAYGLPVVNPIGPDGHFAADLDLVGGEFFKTANAALVADLTDRGLLFRHLEYEHTYPHCWRCHTALLYYAQPSWYIRTTARKDELLAQNEATHWFPETIKHGRYGDWLDNNIDWALSRRRYWGTPLPIWRCAEGHLTCVGSRAELGELCGTSQAELDPHRPFVDDVAFDCPECGSPARREPDVIDAWFDSGAMPFAQWGYPYVAGSVERFQAAYPADFICEAIDQTRGWFYTLMAVGTLVFDQSAYRNVVCLGHILAEDGRKMSKHLGNILEPISLMEEHGADAVRWFMAASGSPWMARRVGHQSIQETVRKVLLTYWNTVAFQALYARAAAWSPTNSTPPPLAQRPVLDRWLASETAQLVDGVTAALENFDTQRVGTLMTQFVDDLSNWYVRRSRRRFWAGDPAALHTLHDTLGTLTRLLAPLTPFITERVWQDLVRDVVPGAVTSVHLASWPQTAAGEVDLDLSAGVALARRVVELGRAARAEAKVKIRQPLRRALIASAAHQALNEELLREIADELNVVAVEPFSSAGELIDFEAKGNFRALGKRFAQRTPQIAAAIAAADANLIAESLRSEGTASVVVDGEQVTVHADEVILTERPREGWAVVNEQGETVALDLELDDELRQAGIAREVIRLLQEGRKNAGFDVSDRIEVHLGSSQDAVHAALTQHQTQIAEEVLAVSFRLAAPGQEPVADAVQQAEWGLWFALSRA